MAEHTGEPSQGGGHCARLIRPGLAIGPEPHPHPPAEGRRRRASGVYRLDRLREITGRDPSKPDGLLVLTLAVKPADLPPAGDVASA